MTKYEVYLKFYYLWGVNDSESVLLNTN